MLVVPVGRVLNCWPWCVSRWPRACLLDAAGESDGVVVKVVLLKRRRDGVGCRCCGHNDDDGAFSWFYQS